MCEQLTAIILRDGKVVAEPDELSHAALELPIFGSLERPRFIPRAAAFELRPAHWRPGDTAEWLDDEVGRARYYLKQLPRPGPASQYEAIADFPTNERIDAYSSRQLEAGDKLAKELRGTDGHVSSMPWIYIAREGKHEIQEIACVVAFGDSEVHVGSAKAAYAFDHAGISVEECPRIQSLKYELAMLNRAEREGAIWALRRRFQVHDNGALAIPAADHSPLVLMGS